jgi:hypothetical protein
MLKVPYILNILIITQCQSIQDNKKNRIIKSLSNEDIESLETGTGDAFGGMAKLAELNDYPGPRHIYIYIRFRKRTRTHNSTKRKYYYNL